MIRKSFLMKLEKILNVQTSENPLGGFLDFIIISNKEMLAVFRQFEINSHNLFSETLKLPI